MSDPGRQTPARMRLVGRRWLWGAFSCALTPVLLGTFGFDMFDLPLLFGAMWCLGYGGLNVGWARGFEAAVKAKNVTDR